jgi:hypothetical protein
MNVWPTGQTEPKRRKKGTPGSARPEGSNVSTKKRIAAGMSFIRDT